MISEKQAAIAALQAAFASDPAVRWTFPEDEAFARNFPEFAMAFGGAAFEHETALLAEGAAALWLPPGVGADEEAMGALMERAVDPALLPHIGAMFVQMGAFHPEEPHWYLPLIGVEPSRQGRGIGTALMLPVLERCDREGTVAYLESSNPRNIALYERLGFRRVGVVQSGSSPEIVAMRRDPA